MLPTEHNGNIFISMDEFDPEAVDSAFRPSTSRSKGKRRATSPDSDDDDIDNTNKTVDPIRRSTRERRRAVRFGSEEVDDANFGVGLSGDEDEEGEEEEEEEEEAQRGKKNAGGGKGKKRKGGDVSCGKLTASFS